VASFIVFRYIVALEISLVLFYRHIIIFLVFHQSTMVMMMVVMMMVMANALSHEEGSKSNDCEHESHAAHSLGPFAFTASDSRICRLGILGGSRNLGFNVFELFRDGRRCFVLKTCVLCNWIRHDVVGVYVLTL